ncbi:hypothetical protein C8Q75DRAFT_763063 [Abortiporus biennis]|nr:hypothetical protein C8Q75DRAFT_763063 [Abortiporus biennis]
MQPQIKSDTLTTSSQAKLPSLDYDVMVYVLPFFVDRNDLLAYATTCRSLYNASVGYVLNILPVDIGSISSLQSFCQYMLSESLRRCQFLKKLNFRFFDWEEITAKISEDLLKIFLNAVNLEALGVHNTDDLIDSNHQIFHTISSLPRLKELSVFTGTLSNRLCGMLRNMQSPLEHLSANFLSTNFLDPLPMLQSVSPTLRKLTFSSGSIRSPLQVPARNVKELVLLLSEEIYTPCLLFSFPALQTLKVEAFQPGGSLATRMANQAVNSRTSWPLLLELSGHIDGIFTLGLTSQIYHLNVYSIDQYTAYMLPVILRDAEPKFFSVKVEMSGMDSTMFDSLIPANAQSKISYIDLELDLNPWLNSSQPIDVDDMMETLHGVLSRLTSLGFLSLTLRYRENEQGEFRDDQVWGALEGMSPEELALDFTESVENLAFVFVHIGRQAPRFWRICAPEGDETSPTFAELPSYRSPMIVDFLKKVYARSHFPAS